MLLIRGLPSLSHIFCFMSVIVADALTSRVMVRLVPEQVFV